MITTSQQFKDEMRAPIRKVYGKIQIDYSDPEIDQSINVTSNDMNYTSYPMQIVNGKDTPNYNYLTLDDTWNLGDEKSLAPGESETEYIQYGLWGEQLSNNNGGFNTNPLIELIFVARPIRSLKLVGDSKKDEYPVDFEIRLYNGGVVYTETVTNNNKVSWTKEIEQINEIEKVEIEIMRWNKPNRVIKIMEVFSSIQEIYEGEDIISINLIEERETSQGSLPVGNISSNEIEIVLNNVNREFDAGNKDSRLYGLVKPNRKIQAWLGTEDELVPLGLFWTKDWDVPEDGVIAKSIGRDRLDRLRESNYSTSKVEVNKTIYELAEIILQDAGLKVDQYWIDEELKSFIVPYAYFEPVSHREALRQLVTACLGQVYCDRRGIVRIEGPSFTFEKLDTLTTMFLQAEFPSEMDIIEGYGISEEDYFRKNNPSRQSDIANHITVETQPLTVGNVEEIYFSSEAREIKTNETTIITINFNHVPCIDVNVNLEGTGTIVATEIYSWGADVTISSTSNGTFTLNATGKPLKVTNSDRVRSVDEDSILENGTIRHEMPKNHLIQNISTAKVIADTLLAYYKDPKRDLEMEWRGNPALELGDIVVVNDYTRGIGEQGYYYATKQELEFAGYLRAKLEGRRAL